MPRVLDAVYHWDVDDDNFDLEQRLKDEAKRKSRYDHRLAAVSITGAVVFTVVGLPTQNGWVAFIVAVVAASFVNLVVKESFRIDDN